MLVAEKISDCKHIVRHINRRYKVSEKIGSEIEAIFRNNRNLKSIKFLCSDSRIIRYHPNPISCLFISSVGILDETQDRVRVPSYALWEFAKKIHNSQALADVIVLDPNIISYGNLIKFLCDKNFDLIAHSVIPVNLENDLRIYSLVVNSISYSRYFIGGVLSELLEGLDLDNNLDAKLITKNGEGVLNESIKEIAQEKAGKILNVAGFSLPLSIDKDIAKEMPIRKMDLVHDMTYSTDTFYVITNNQCKHKCFWCSSPKDGPYYSEVSEVISYIKSADLTDETSLVVADNDFSYNLTWSKKVCNLMIKKNIINPKHCKSSIAGMKNDFLEVLSQANFKRVAYGVESFDLRERKKLGKHFSDEKLSSVLSKTLSVGIIPEINLILFSPFSSLESLKTNLEKSLLWSKKGAYIFSTFGLYSVPGTIKKELPFEKKKIFFSGMKEPIYFPHTYTPSKETLSLFNESRDAFLSAGSFLDIPNHAKSILKLKCIAECMGNRRLVVGFDDLFNRIKEDDYINI